MSAPDLVQARCDWFAERLAFLGGLPSKSAVLLELDDQLLSGKITLRSSKIFLSALHGQGSCPNNCQGEGGTFLVFKGLSVVEGGHYCDPEEALAGWEAHVNSELDNDVVLKYL